MLIRDVCSHAACSLKRSGTVVAKSGGWTEGVEVRGLSEKTGTDPFLLQLLWQASEELFLHSLCILCMVQQRMLWSCSLFVCSQLVLLCSKDLLHWWPTLFCYWPEELLSCGCLWWWTVTTSQCRPWLLDVNDCFFFCEHICEYCISVYFST